MYCVLKANHNLQNIRVPPTGYGRELHLHYCLVWLVTVFVCQCLQHFSLIPRWLPCWSARCRAMAWRQRLASVEAQKKRSSLGRCLCETSGNRCHQSCKSEQNESLLLEGFGVNMDDTHKLIKCKYCHLPTCYWHSSGVKNRNLGLFFKLLTYNEMKANTITK